MGMITPDRQGDVSKFCIQFIDIDVDRGRLVVSIFVLSAVVLELDIPAFDGCDGAQELEDRGGLASACCFDRSDGEIGFTVVANKLPAGARVALAPGAAG